jgi:hypothetical protein
MLIDGVITYYIDKANITNSNAIGGHNPNNTNSNTVDNRKGMAAATTPPVGIFYRKFYLVIYDLL